jgi:hypothetical protein
MLSSGQTTISRYSLDLMRQQRNQRAGTPGAPSTSMTSPISKDNIPQEEKELAAFLAKAFYDDDALEKEFEELAKNCFV